MILLLHQYIFGILFLVRDKYNIITHSDRWLDAVSSCKWIKCFCKWIASSGVIAYRMIYEINFYVIFLRRWYSVSLSRHFLGVYSWKNLNRENTLTLQNVPTFSVILYNFLIIIEYKLVKVSKKDDSTENSYRWRTGWLQHRFVKIEIFSVCLRKAEVKSIRCTKWVSWSIVFLSFSWKVPA